MGLNDVKLFSKSFFSQPNLVASSVFNLPCSPMVESHTSIIFSNISIPMAVFGIRRTLSKVYRMDFVAFLFAFETWVVCPYWY